MHHTEVCSLWDSIFKKLGYRETKFNNWVSETQELIVILSVKADDKKKDIYIDIGIILKKLYKDDSLTAPVLEDLDIGQGLYNILYYMGEYEYYLNNLFCYDPEINTDAEINENCREIAMLFLTKVFPHIEQLDVYAWLTDNFNKEESWKPFLQYFVPSPETDEHFYGALEKYYRRRDNRC